MYIVPANAISRDSVGERSGLDFDASVEGP